LNQSFPWNRNYRWFRLNQNFPWNRNYRLTPENQFHWYHSIPQTQKYQAIPSRHFDQNYH
jgi:hypothetical protein